MAKIFEFLATGFEEVEAMAPVDIFRRGGLDIKTVSITGQLDVAGAHGVSIRADMLFEDAPLDGADLLMLPGGLPGATNLNEHEGLKAALLRQAKAGRKIAAICAAPLVLGGLGLLKGKRATCYPGFEKYMIGAEYTQQLCTVDGNIITGEGPAASFPYSYTLLEMLAGVGAAEPLKEGMMYNHLMS